MEIKPSLMVQAMVLATLSGRTPLYRLEEFMTSQAIKLLLGKDIDSKFFNGNNSGRMLDTIFKASTSHIYILTELGIQATKIFKLDSSVIHYDTTSTNALGELLLSDKKDASKPNITYEHSKDHRPDLKQL